MNVFNNFRGRCTESQTVLLTNYVIKKNPLSSAGGFLSVFNGIVYMR